MKTKFLTKGLTEEEINIAKQAMAEVKKLLPSFNFTFQTTNVNFSSLPFKNDVAQGYLLDNTQLLPLVDGTDDIVCLLYDWTLINPQPTNPATSLIKKGNTIPMAIPKQWYNGYVEVLVQFFLHELSHAEAFRAGIKDLTHDFYASNFTQVPGTGLRDFYLFLIKPFVNQTSPLTPPTATIPMYKYFQPKEIVGLKPELVALLDQARGIAGIPFKINSGFRTVAQNTAVGGVVNSAHLTGEAVDISCIDSTKRMKIVKALLQVGFNRIETVMAHVHCDISKTLPQGVFILPEKD